MGVQLRVVGVWGVRCQIREWEAIQIDLGCHVSLQFYGSDLEFVRSFNNGTFGEVEGKSHQLVES